jgi:sigma-B regulation protein RsbU (phosphoserine phosphatase)
MPARSQALFLAGTFLLFLPAGLLSDIAALGAKPLSRLVLTSLMSGGIAVAYMLITRYRVRWLPILVVAHVAASATLGSTLPAMGAPLAGAALERRLTIDVQLVTLSLVASFILLSIFIRLEGTRLGRLRAEVELAQRMHRVLVPPIDRRLPGLEIRGASAASGEVGGDLVDVVVTPHGWTAYVVDVSGHGVASGLLMGMVKSAARVALGGGARLAPLLTLLNRVLFDLKSPTMFATFAGIQSADGGTLAFTLAGHLPILWRRAATRDVSRLTMSQLPIAMFDDTAYEATPIDATPGDLFVILTDGLTEVTNGKDEELGLERLEALVAAHGDEPLAALERRIFDAVRAHGPQLDDQSLLLVRVV